MIKGTTRLLATTLALSTAFLMATAEAGAIDVPHLEGIVVDGKPDDCGRLGVSPYFGRLGVSPYLSPWGQPLLEKTSCMKAEEESSAWAWQDC